MANGHPEARYYPVAMVWDEAEIVVDRLNNFHVTQSVLVQLAVGSLLSKEGAAEFKKQTTRLIGDGK